MKNIVAFSVVLALFSLPVAATNGIEYKCYLDTSQGKEIGFFRWNDTQLNKKMAALVASKRKDNSGKNYYVKQALECVPLSQDFKLKAAQKLDKATLR